MSLTLTINSDQTRGLIKEGGAFSADAEKETIKRLLQSMMREQLLPWYVVNGRV
jgi:hypothetical protein